MKCQPKKLLKTKTLALIFKPGNLSVDVVIDRGCVYSSTDPIKH